MFNSEVDPLFGTSIYCSQKKLSTPSFVLNQPMHHWELPLDRSGTGSAYLAPPAHGLRGPGIRKALGPAEPDAGEPGYWVS
jgi:hypothetical protein